MTSSHTILCVDDEHAGLMVRKLLLEHLGYSVLTAETSGDALALFRNHAIDAVILDYYLPAQNGDALAAAMRESRPNVPILILSAYPWLPEGATASADAFLVKGQPTTILLQKLQELIGNQRAAATAS